MRTCAKLMRTNLQDIPSPSLRAALLVMMTISGVVLVEPAPFDILIAVFFTVLVLCGRLKLPSIMRLPLGLLAAFLFFNCASGGYASDNTALARFFIINVYMVVIFLSIAGVVYTWRDGAHIVYQGYFISCVLIGSISLFFFFSGHHPELVFVNGRLKGTFKDPNVFAPFMVLGVLYCLSRIEECKRWFVPIYFFCIVLLVFSVVLSASRGAWINLAVAVIAYLLARVAQASRSGVSAMKIFILVLIAGSAGAVVAAAADYAQLGDFLAVRAQLQEYDESRFAVQGLGLQMAMDNLLGYGPGQFEVELGSTVWTGSNAAHSLFVRLLFENGLGGFLSLLLFLGLSLAVAIRLATIRWRFRALACISGSSLIGGIVNSAVIDTLHWRHFWIQLGITWGLYVLYRRDHLPVTPAPAGLS